MLVTPSQIDSLLLPFLEAADERVEAELLTRLMVEHAEPIVLHTLRSRLQAHLAHGEGRFNHPDVEEVYSDIRLCLVRRLRAFKADPAQRPIGNFAGYVATTARNTCDEYLRRKYPQRRYLKDKIRYHLITHGDFALWEDAARGWLCGLAAWRARGAAPAVGDGLYEPLRQRLRHLDATRLKLDALLRLIFRTADAPLGLNDLVALVAGLRGVEDRPPESVDDEERRLGERLAGPSEPPQAGLEYRELLQQLWGEIRKLPRRQRVALLLNLRNPHGVNVITLLPATGVAGLEELADALEMPVEQFEQLWPRLPLDDLSIAEYLGATRQQVINLRKTARDRLARRVSNI